MPVPTHSTNEPPDEIPHPPGSPVRWLVIGDARRAEMRSLLATLSHGGLTSPPTVYPDVAAAEPHCQRIPPDLVVVLESWPDEFPADHVHRLLTFAPLARVVCVAGFWCEAAGRTRRHWPPALHVPVWAAEARLRYEIDVLHGRCTAIPWTASREEVLGQTWCAQPMQHAPISAWVPRSGMVRGELFDPALVGLFREQLQDSGWSLATDAQAPVRYVLVQAEPASAVDLRVLAERCRQAAPAAVVAVTSWPLPEWIAQLHAAGVAGVFNPLSGESLPAFLDRLTTMPPDQ
jgi:hypothetical protein